MGSDGLKKIELENLVCSDIDLRPKLISRDLDPNTLELGFSYPSFNREQLESLSRIPIANNSVDNPNIGKDVIAVQKIIQTLSRFLTALAQDNSFNKFINSMPKFREIMSQASYDSTPLGEVALAEGNLDIPDSFTISNPSNTNAEQHIMACGFQKVTYSEGKLRPKARFIISYPWDDDLDLVEKLNEKGIYPIQILVEGSDQGPVITEISTDLTDFGILDDEDGDGVDYIELSLKLHD